MLLKVAICAVFLVVGASAGFSLRPKVCPDGSPPVVCVTSPCPPCPGFPDPIPEPCPPGVPVAACKADPCEVTKCPAFPNAKCESNFCGGCNAVFTVNGKKVDCKPESPCPPGVPIVNCFADPCQVNTCEAFPNAECRSNFCGGCNAEFFVDGKKVDCTPKEEPCQIQCLIDPCSPIANPTCPRFPNAKCVSKCCQREWFVDGKKVDCNLPDISDRVCLKEGKRCPNFSKNTSFSRKAGQVPTCCKGTSCCACGPPVVRPDTPPPLFGTCRSRCICPIG